MRVDFIYFATMTDHEVRYQRFLEGLKYSNFKVSDLA